MTYKSSKNANQPSFDDFGTPLSQVTFCVVDLETTGTGQDSAITEFGAVKVCGGEVIGEFASLVNPRRHISAMVSTLTGITDAMVADAPTIEPVLASFLEFARNTTLVAHNAGFDIGFLKRACASLNFPWPGNPVIDTVKLARHLLSRDEVSNVKLATLARFFKVPDQPTHRALDDARATVHVLHGLLERVGSFGVTTLEDLLTFNRRVSPARRAKRRWVKDLPQDAGVYQFYTDAATANGGREVLYVGKSTNIKRRVASYFTAAETRGRMEEMIRVASGVEAIVCQTALEAEIRELRMIDSLKPRYNSRSKRQHKVNWLKLTTERWPRLSVVKQVRDDNASYFGPFSSRQEADQVVEALWEFQIRQCNQRLTANSKHRACVLADIGRCIAPCLGASDEDSYAQEVRSVESAMHTDARQLVKKLSDKMEKLAGQERFEEAGETRDKLLAFLAAAQRWQNLTSVSRCPQIVAALWDDGWQINVIRYGMLAAAGRADKGTSALAVMDKLVDQAATIRPKIAGLPAGSAEECARIVAWLTRPGIRLMDIDGDWSMPIYSYLPLPGKYC